MLESKMKTILINKNNVNRQIIQLHGSQDFSGMMESIELNANSFYEFTSENGFVLLCGMGKECCIIQFSHINGEPPYDVAISPIPLSIDGEVIFYIDNTPTEIPSELCISTECAFDIIKYFLDYAKKFPSVEWQEI